MTDLILSPSAIETYGDPEHGCARKWAWDKIGKVPRSSHPSTKVGTIVHKRIETYLEHGTPPNRLEHLTLTHKDKKHTYYPGRVAMSMIPFLPPAGSVPKEDLESYFTIQLGGFLFHGYKDMRHNGILWDHKTTGDLQWAKTEAQLRRHPQPLIYGADELAKGINPVPSQWTYGQTKGKNRAKAVRFTLTQDEILSGLDKYVFPIAEQIIDAWGRIKDPKELAPNTRACDLMGGCSYKKLCNLTGREKLVGIMNKQELMEKIKQRAAEKLGNATGEETPAKLSTLGKATPEVTPEVTPKVSALDNMKAKKAVRAEGVNPPEASVVSVQEHKTPLSESERRGILQTTVFPPRGEEEITTIAPVSGFSLFVDCEPVNWPGGKVRAEELIAPAAAQVCEEANAPHYRVIDFGKGPGFLAAQVKDNLERSPLPVGTAVIMSLRSTEGRDIYQTLYELAASVVIG